jgi:hypothetical protein
MIYATVKGVFMAVREIIKIEILCILNLLKIMNYSEAQFSLLKKRDDNFDDTILQYLFEETQLSQT